MEKYTLDVSLTDGLGVSSPFLQVSTLLFVCTGSLLHLYSQKLLKLSSAVDPNFETSFVEESSDDFVRGITLFVLLLLEVADNQLIPNLKIRGSKYS